LLKLVHVCQALPRDLVVKVICRDAGLLEELDVLELLGADEDGRPEMEVDDHDQLVVPARLEEGMLDIGERDVYDVILLGDEADTVLMNLKVAHGLLSNDVGTNDKVLEHLLLALDCLKSLDLTIACPAILRQRVLSGDLLVFDPLKQILDLLGGGHEVVLSADLGALILKSQLSDKEGVGVFGLLGELKGRATWGVEVDAQIGPLALGLDRARFDGGDMEGHKGTSVVVGDKDRKVGVVNVEETWLEVLGDLLLIRVRLDLVHLLHLLLLG
jgi:hypothetical protein